MQLHNTLALASLLGMTGAIVHGQEELNERRQPNLEKQVDPLQKQ
jgi:hypothetical protein